MLEILNIPDVRERVAPITIERYHRMIDLGLFAEWNVELLNGGLVERMSKSALHQFLVDLLVSLLRNACSESDFWVRQEGPITIGDSEPEPNVSAVRGVRAQFKHANPSTAQFVIEVCVSSLAIDRAKALDYAKAGVVEYWIVRPGAKLTEVYLEPNESGYAEVVEIPAQTTLDSVAMPGFKFNLAETIED